MIKALRTTGMLASAVFLMACPRDAAKPEAPSSSKSPSVPTPPPLDPAVRARAVAGLASPVSRGPDFVRGVSLGLFASDPDRARRLEIYDHLLGEIAGVGATHVQLVVRWSQADVSAHEIAPGPSSTGDDELREVIARAQRHGLSVFLLPIVDLTTRRGKDWRGVLEPSDPDAWWSSYGAFILHYARLAERAGGVGLLSVGSELLSLERFDARWRHLIEQVRAVYSGRLTYSANWDHYEPVPFWDVLDVAGVTAYAPLSQKRAPAEATLVEGFDHFYRRLAFWAAREGRRVLLTEIGYPSHPRGAFRPWDHRPRPTPDPELQLMCFRAMYTVLNAEERLAGLFVWNWFGRGGMSDTGYTLRGKPAASVLSRWYRGR